MARKRYRKKATKEVLQENSNIEQPKDRNGNELDLHERNLFLVQTASDIFSYHRGVHWDDLRRNIASNQIRDLYKVITWLWPPSTNIEQILPKPGHNLRALYLGDIEPQHLIRNVLQFSLYSDEILIFDPFHNPWFMANEFDPIIHPDQYRSDTLRLLFFLLVLEPWIRAGYVKIIPRPDHWDPVFWHLAEQRISNSGWKPEPEDMSETEKIARDGYLRFLATLPKDQIIKTIKSVPDFSEDQVENLANYILRIRRTDPLALNQSVEETGGQILVGRTGANLETAMYVAHLTGAFPYTNMRSRWKELLSVTDDLPEAARIWSPLTKAFQELDFKFLNNVDSKFAYSLRSDGRLESFRSFLRKLWNTVGGDIDPLKIDSLARDFKDELIDEYRKAQAEWSEIDRELLMWAASSAAAAVGAAGATQQIIPGGMSVVFPLIGSGLFTVSKLLETRLKRREFRKKIPMSVFIDLSQHKVK